MRTSSAAAVFAALSAAALALSSTCSLGTTARAQAQVPAYRVIVNAGVAHSQLARGFVTDAFLRKVSHWPQGAPIRPVDQDGDSAVRRKFSSEVLRAHLQLFFGYCLRFYARQFQARAQVTGHVLTRLQRHIESYLASTRPREEGLPTVAACARELGYSADYLSDLLREETGQSTREHLHRIVIDAAKRRLAGSGESIGEIAYALGFEQPQHFSKLFKQKTGHSPGAWRAQPKR